MGYGSQKTSANPNSFLAEVVRPMLLNLSGMERINSLFYLSEQSRSMANGHSWRYIHSLSVVQRLLYLSVATHLEQVLSELDPSRGTLFHRSVDLEAERCTLGRSCVGSIHSEDPLTLDSEIDRLMLASRIQFSVEAGVVDSDKLPMVLHVIGRERTVDSLMQALGDLELHHALEALEYDGLATYDQRVVVQRRLRRHALRPNVESTENPGTLHENLVLTAKGEEMLARTIGAVEQKLDAERRLSAAIEDAEEIQSLVNSNKESIRSYSNLEDILMVARMVAAEGEDIDGETIMDFAKEINSSRAPGAILRDMATKGIIEASAEWVAALYPEKAIYRLAQGHGKATLAVAVATGQFTRPTV